MGNAVEILDQGFACLVDHMGVIEAEYFDKMESGEFAAKASTYADNHPFTGKAQIL